MLKDSTTNQGYTDSSDWEVTSHNRSEKFFWNILEQEANHNEVAQWIKDQKDRLQINQIEWKDIAYEDIESTW